MSQLFEKDAILKSTFLDGFRASFASFKVINKNPSILIFYIIPFLLNIILLSVLVYFAFINIDHILKSYLTGDTWYIKLLNILIVPILLVFLIFVTTIIYGFVGNILCAPLLDTLSQKTQEAITGQKDDEPFSLKRFLGDFVRTFKNLFKMLAVIILVYILSLFLFLIPLIGPVFYSVVGYFTASFILGLQFLDYPLDRKRYTFMEKLKITWKFKYSAVGLGLSFLIVSMIPIVGFLGINMCVMGATIIFEKNISSTLSKCKADQPQIDSENMKTQL